MTIRLFLLFATVASLAGGFRAALAEQPIDIGSRRELFVDEHLIDRLGGDAQLQVQRPSAREVVLTTDAPWEGNTSAYYTVFRDGELYRMYYRGSHYDEQTRKGTHPEVVCYAESKDGVHWVKPKLGLIEFNGSTENNIVWDGIGTHCFAAFKDGNPACPPEARYKAISRGRPQGKKGLYIFQSPDGLRWKLMHDEPVITEGAFDSQNLAFWDPQIGKYREYHRTFTNGVRAIMTGTSDDFVHWTKPVLLDFGDAPNEHLYTNAVLPYFRAPHLLLGFPTRYLPNEGQRVEPTLMASRDGVRFRRWTTAIIPEEAPQDRGGNRSNYMAWGLVERPGVDDELSVYATEAYYTGPDSRIRRFAYREDGFVALHAGADGGTLTTRPLAFDGKQLELNYVAQEGGQVRVELRDADGQPIEGFTAGDCRPLTGDATGQIVGWSGGSDIGALAGRPVRLHLELTNADVFAFQFR